MLQSDLHHYGPSLQSTAFTDADVMPETFHLQTLWMLLVMAQDQMFPLTCSASSQIGKTSCSLYTPTTYYKTQHSVSVGQSLRRPTNRLITTTTSSCNTFMAPNEYI